MTTELNGDYRRAREKAHVISLDTVTSTNDYAAQLVADGRLDRNGMTIVLAREQTQGRGRLDHTWVSVPGKSFIASVICIVNADTAKDPQVNGWLQMIAGMSVIDALRETVMSANMDWLDHTRGNPSMRSELQLKWPNDIVYQGMKLGGILAQLVQIPGDENSVAIIFGVGLNLDLAPDQLPTAQSTSLQLIASCVNGAACVPADQLADMIAAGLVNALSKRLWYFGENPPGYAQNLHRRIAEECWTLGKPVLVHRTDGTTLTGEAVAINEDASLSVRDDSGQVHVVRTGDVGVLPVED